MTVAADSLTTLNQQLAALAEAGVPVDLGIDSRASEAVGNRDRKRRIEAERTVEDVAAGMAVRTSLGQPLEQALEHGKPQSQQYRYRMLLGLKQDNPASALEESQSVARAAAASQRVTTQSFSYPLIVMAVAYLGLIVASVWLTPTMVSIYESLAEQPSWSLKVLMSFRATLLYWAIGLPLLAMGWWLAIRWNRGPRDGVGPNRLAGRLRGRHPSLELEQHATFATLLASLLKQGEPLQEAIPVAAFATSGLLYGDLGHGDPRHVDPAPAEPQSPNKSTEIDGENEAEAEAEAALDPRFSPESAFAKTLPELLHWALYAPEAEADRPAALEGIAETYRHRRARRLRSRQSWAPTITYPLIAGGVTLFYALLVFLPLIELVSLLGANSMRHGQPW